MELRDYIEAAIRVTGTGPELATLLGIGSGELANARDHRHSLPAGAIEKLAEVLHCSSSEVHSASDTISWEGASRRIHMTTPCEKCASRDDCPYPSEKSCPNCISFRKH